MKKIVKADLPVEKRFITVEEGREIFKGQTYKLELLEEYAEKAGSFRFTGRGILRICAPART